MVTRRVWLKSTIAAAGGLLLSSRLARSDDPQLNWHNVEEWGVEGRAWSDSPHLRYFDRFPAKAEKTVPPAVWSLSRHSAGMAVRFRTNATSIWVDYTLLSDHLAMPHMPATGVSGVDLYAEDEHGVLRWVSVSHPAEQHIRAKLGDGIDPGTRTYMMYLPLYNGVDSVQIGVPPESLFEGLSPRDVPPIVFYGTSIMQGGCASRPGMALPAIIGRRLARPTVNIGFSGNGRMDPSVVDLLADVDAAAFCIDCLPNMGPQEVADRTEPLVKHLREARPNAAIVLIEDRVFTNAEFFATEREHHQANHAALRHAYESLMSGGIAKLHYLSADDLLGDDGEATVDGSHPSDLGFERYANAYEKILRGPRMNFVDLYNAIEIGLWLVMALIMVVLCFQAPGRYRKIVLSIGAILFVAFAGSDAIEFYTGAWWRPWWLLCWKGACLIGLFSVAIAYWMAGRGELPVPSLRE